MHSAETFIALAIAVAACGFDLRTRRIPNALTFGAAIVAVAFGVLRRVIRFMSLSGRRLAARRRPFSSIFALGGMGAKAWKLLGAIGAWLGPRSSLRVAFIQPSPVACSPSSSPCGRDTCAGRSAI
jgi:prepilin peptidase CpaA